MDSIMEEMLSDAADADQNNQKYNALKIFYHKGIGYARYNNKIKKILLTYIDYRYNIYI